MHSTSLLDEALAHHQAGRFAEATALYRALLEIEPQNADALHLLGVLAIQNGTYEEAVSLITRAVQIAPNAGTFYQNLGAAHGYLGNYDEEEAAYRRALTLRPDFKEACDSLVECLQNKGDQDEAMQIRNAYLRAAEKKNYYLSYQQNVDAMRRSPYLDYPSHVHMETLAKCNAACDFCPYPTLERQGEKMSDALVGKIIQDLTDVPRHIQFQLSPFKVNEPFLDVRLFDIIGDINAKLPQARVTLTSNASPINEKNLAQLAAASNIEYLWISFNDHREKEYEKTMQLPFKRTVERLDLIHEKKAAGTLNFNIVLSRVGDNSDADQAFVAWCRQRYPLFGATCIPRGSWIGQVKDIDQNVPKVGCGR